MCKLMTDRVPYRGKTKQLLREHVITAPLKRPLAQDHPHSATAPAKDITYPMLKKNPVERLGSRNYSDLKTHPFFDRFDRQMLCNRTDLCDIPSIAEIMMADDAQKGSTGPEPEDRRRHLAIEEMTDIALEAQKPLLCHASGSFKKLMNTVRDSRAVVLVSGPFLETSGLTTTTIDGRAITPGKSSSKSGMESTGNDAKKNASSSTEKVDLILFRKRKFYKYWSFDFYMRKAKGEEENKYFLYVDGVNKDSPAEPSQVLPLDVTLSVNGIGVDDVAPARKVLSACADQLGLSVMSSSSYRVLTTRRDVMSLARGWREESAVLKNTSFYCLASLPYGVGIIDANVWDEKAKRFTTVFMISACPAVRSHIAEVTPVNSVWVYPGDVVAQMDGVNLEGLALDQVTQMLNSATSDITLDVVPLSPMRMLRILISNLHETAMTDTNVASRTTAAKIESQ